MNTRFLHLIYAVTLFAAGCVASALLNGQTAPTRHPDPTLEGFTFHQAGFDEDISRTEVRLPKSWKLVGVAPGARANVSILWFQDDDGTLYGMTGFANTGRDHDFVFVPEINKIARK
jgi:hypothetical protein